ncbi:uncharacterized protein G2W53_007405 [Senna tora]|uniref:Uncharacterized protein n=1 Tax=Senna tora TaxID=362788 RepID=A0A834X637_9FABA|nr:uncharacterized protein G2W53_007405 [Senna tora]
MPLSTKSITSISGSSKDKFAVSSISAPLSYSHASPLMSHILVSPFLYSNSSHNMMKKKDAQEALEQAFEVKVQKNYALPTKTWDPMKTFVQESEKKQNLVHKKQN